MTSTFFEGRKVGSAMCQFNKHSKEKRTDAKVIALALVVNQGGFIKYSQLYKGNIRDSKTLLNTVYDLGKRASGAERKPVALIFIMF